MQCSTIRLLYSVLPEPEYSAALLVVVSYSVLQILKSL